MPLDCGKNLRTPQTELLGLFANLDIKFIDRNELTELWVSTYSGTNASLD